MNPMEQIIYTIEGIPSDQRLFFENFINILTQKQFWVKGTQYQIIEPGPRDNFSTIFQLIPASNSIIQFTINFVEKPAGIDVLYDKSMEFNVPDNIAGKLMKKMIERQKNFLERSLDGQLVPLIQISIKEAIKITEKQDEKESKADSEDPLQILKVKFAKGEISEEEYLQKKKILEE
jgi:hypothetical protein